MTDLDAASALPRPCTECWEIHEPADLNDEQVCLACNDPDVAATADFDRRVAEMDLKLAEMAKMPTMIIHHDPKT